MKTRLAQHKNEVMQQLNPDLPNPTDTSSKAAQARYSMSSNKTRVYNGMSTPNSRQTIFHKAAAESSPKQVQVQNGGDPKKDPFKSHTKSPP